MFKIKRNKIHIKEKINQKKEQEIEQKKIFKLSKKNCSLILTILFLTLIIIFSLDKNIYANSPRMVNKIYDSFSKIQRYITRVSTPIAGVAFGTGLLMRKFSFGDEERVRKSKKLIRDTAVAYALILCLDLILSFIETLAG